MIKWFYKRMWKIKIELKENKVELIEKFLFVAFFSFLTFYRVFHVFFHVFSCFLCFREPTKRNPFQLVLAGFKAHFYSFLGRILLFFMFGSSIFFLPLNGSSLVLFQNPNHVIKRKSIYIGERLKLARPQFMICWNFFVNIQIMLYHFFVKGGFEKMSRLENKTTRMTQKWSKITSNETF